MQKSLMLTIVALLSGCGLMKQHEAVQTLHYTCGTLPLSVTQDNQQQQVSFIMDGKPLVLKQEAAASGNRYSDGTYVFWSKGNGAVIERNNKIVIDDCELHTAG
ncbi:hypothetical protein PMPD1_2118 [Paramixta manurensis]|uniref:C-type lysozyme inhibitor domain-containing protein n=1 Tax=Paramixta manurensis TaxID=2740817 RepID=A0A6M8UBX7_9GAMM|nr:hypothetical protein PMPD1_2118 [Erwiniaceae bacterium PD-1]